MKARLSVSALAAVLMLAPFAASADTTPGWYADAGVGGNFAQDSITSTSGGDRTAEFHNGWDALGGFGYAWGNNLRSEFELSYSRAGIDKLKGVSTGNGALSNTDIFANGFYDFNMGKMWTPYIGLGIGAAIPEANHIGPLTNGGAFNDEDLEFAYQAIAGVSAQLDDNWAVTADYRFIGTPDVTFKTTAGGTGNMENMSHNVILGVRYSFGAPPAIAHASSPAMHYKPAKAQEPAEVPESYMVFFDFNKSGLTSQAQQILTSAASDYKSGKYQQIVVTGHTDTVGSEGYNKKLSVRRAAIVKKELEKLGVPAKAIVAKGVGKQDLMVPTADGVREAQNRRAEVVFGSR